MKIGCEAYIKQLDTVMYHIITVDEVTIETKCHLTDLRIYWFIREGTKEQVNCPMCKGLSDTD